MSEVTDPPLIAGALPSPLRLPYEPIHRRGWVRIDGALRRRAVDAPVWRGAACSPAPCPANEAAGRF